VFTGDVDVAALKQKQPNVDQRTSVRISSSFVTLSLGVYSLLPEVLTDILQQDTFCSFGATRYEMLF